MKSISHPETLAAIKGRILALTPDSPRQWGRMTAHQALAHMADQVRIANGDIPTQFAGNWFSTSVMKQLVLWGLPAPKGKVQTAKEIDQAIAGTPITTFDADQQTLIRLVEWLATAPANTQFTRHPFFGNMNQAQWCKLAYTHLDHHLRQFNV